MEINEPAVNTPPEVDPAEALRTHVAYHEAGHAVVAALLDHHIEWAAIGPARGLQGGRVVNQGPAPTTTRAVVEDMAITCAGLVAETLSPHQHLLRDASLNRIDDLLGITGTVTTYFPAASTQEQQQLWQVAHDCAADLLEQPEHKAAVHSLAALLLQQGEVSHEEVMALIHQARDQEQAARLSAQFARDRRLWRWYLCSLGVLFVVEMTAIGLLTLVVNVWLLLALTVVCSALLPWCLWKMALRRFGEDEPAAEAQGETKQRRIWSLVDYGVFGLDIAGSARSRRKAKQQMPPVSQRPARWQYDRHRRLPQRKKKSI